MGRRLFWLQLNGIVFQKAVLHRVRVGDIAIPYGLDGPRSSPGVGQDFPFPSRPVLGFTQLPVQLLPDVFPGGKAAGVWRRPSIYI